MTTDAIGFNFIPGSGVTAPIMAFEVNSGGQYTSTSRLVLFGHKTAAGIMPMETQVVVSSQQQADIAAGPGSMLREMFRVGAANAPVQPIWLVALPEVGTAPQWTMTIAALPAGGGVATFKSCGETITVTVGPTDTNATLAANLAAAVNAYYNPLTNAMLPFTAAVAAGVMTLTARHAGQIMNDITFWVPTNVSGNVLAANGVCTIAQTVPGVGTPDASAPLAAIGDQPADFIVSPWTDSTSTGLYTAAMSDVSGRWAWLRQSYGHVYGTITSSFAGATTWGLGLNDRHQTGYRRLANTPTPSWLWATGMTARVAPWLSDCVTGNVSRNQTGLIVQGLVAPYDLSANPLDNYSARNTLNNSGVSTFTVDAYGNVCIDKIVTTYRSGPSGQPDTVFRDIQAMYQVSGGLSYQRGVLATMVANKGLAASNPGGLAAIATPSDYKSAFIAGYTQLCANGVFQDADTYARMLVVAFDTQNPDRVNVYAAYERVNPGDVLAANATIYQQYPALAA